MRMQSLVYSWFVVEEEIIPTDNSEWDISANFKTKESSVQIMLETINNF